MLIEFHKDGIEWGFNPEQKVKSGGVHYIYWWNWLPKDSRYIGIESMYYDGPHWTFGFWFFNISWSFPCNKWEPENMWNFRFPVDWRKKND